MFHKQPAKFPVTTTNYSRWPGKTDKEVEDLISDAIASALAAGFHVGKKVRRTTFSQNEIGRIVMIQSDKEKIISYGGTPCVIQVAWPGNNHGAFASHYNHTELELVEEK